MPICPKCKGITAKEGDLCPCEKERQSEERKCKLGCDGYDRPEDGWVCVYPDCVVKRAP